MNYEITMALLVLFFGVRGTIRVLKSGTPENALILEKERFKKMEDSLKNRGAYFSAYIICLLFGLFLIFISLNYIYSRLG